MNSPTAESVLRAVRRRLRLSHASEAARFAAWTTVAIALVGVLLHLFVRPVSFASVALATSICWTGALVQAAATRIGDADCAAWADRFLGGHSAYATYLEHSSVNGRQDSPARRRLAEWLEQAAPRSLERLESMLPDAGLLKPVAAAAVATMLALVLLQLPAHRVTQLSAQSTTDTPNERDATSAQSAATAEITAGDPGSTSRARGSRPGEKSAGGERKTMAPATAGERASAERVDAADAHQQAAGASEAAAGGRDAGESPDTAPDPGLSEAWQGALTASLRSLSEPPQEKRRTDAAVAADFTGASRIQAASPSPMIVPAAAVAPEARRATPLGPAEQAYVRAYFAGSGAEP